MKLRSLSVFFPCYNEEKNVLPMVRQFLDVLPTLAHRFEILIINDGSSDQTGRRADALARKYSCVRVIHHRKNLGYGASLRTGFSNAKYAWIFFTDGDLQFDVRQLRAFLPFTKKHSVIIGYRKKRAEGSLRAMNARLFKVYIDLLFRLHVRDIDCAFKLLNTQLVQSLKLQSTGAFTSAELLYRLKKKGHHFQQLPVDHYPRQHGQPTGNNIRVIIRAGLEAFSLYLQIHFPKMWKRLRSAGQRTHIIQAMRVAFQK